MIWPQPKQKVKAMKPKLLGNPQKGTSLIIAMTVVCVIMGLLLFYLQLSLQNARLQDENEFYSGAIYAAESALMSAHRDINAAAISGADLTGETITGCYSSPVLMTIGDIPYRYTTSVVNLPLATKVVTANVTFPDPAAPGNVAQRRIEMTLRGKAPHPLYHYAIFAGCRDAGHASGYAINLGGKKGTPCTSCNGTGRRICTTCGGDNQVTCSSCSGTGKVNCPTCKNKTPAKNYCSTCGKTGKVNCSSCGGKGWKTCPSCTDGTRPCSTCGGDGLTGTDQADRINGNIYSGEGVNIVDDAEVRGNVVACGSVNGNTADPATYQIHDDDLGNAIPPPDLQAMKYHLPNTHPECPPGGGHDYNVAAELAAAGTSGSWTNNGTAQKQILNPNHPCHIFRLNPSDRAGSANTPKSGYLATSRDDYFLEDPTVSGNTINTIDGQPCAATYRVNMAPGSDNKVFYIYGNLWIHNLRAYDMAIRDANGNGAKMTLVVCGNVYISDNIRYKVNDPTAAVAIIAISDGESYTDVNGNGIYDAGEPILRDDGDGVYEGPAEGQGNIYFGDAVFGTLEQMDSFLYAENNFYDTNLDASGSKKVILNGNMTAGNLVSINRDYGTQHSQLIVNFDNRIANGTLPLTGLPSMNTQSSNASPWRIVCRREIF